jgi:hypothetical protein
MEQKPPSATAAAVWATTMMDDNASWCNYVTSLWRTLGDADSHQLITMKAMYMLRSLAIRVATPLLSALTDDDGLHLRCWSPCTSYDINEWRIKQSTFELWMRREFDSAILFEQFRASATDASYTLPIAFPIDALLRACDYQRRNDVHHLIVDASTEWVPQFAKVWSETCLRFNNIYRGGTISVYNVSSDTNMSNTVVPSELTSVQVMYYICCVIQECMIDLLLTANSIASDIPFGRLFQSYVAIRPRDTHDNDDGGHEKKSTDTANELLSPLLPLPHVVCHYTVFFACHSWWSPNAHIVDTI